jgi:hypothetical protein
MCQIKIEIVQLFIIIVTNKYQMNSQSRTRSGKIYSAKSTNVPTRTASVAVHVPVAVTVPVAVPVTATPPVPVVAVATAIEHSHDEVNEFDDPETYKGFVGVPFGFFFGIVTGFTVMAFGGSLLAVATTCITTFITVSIGIGFVVIVNE